MPKNEVVTYTLYCTITLQWTLTLMTTECSQKSIANDHREMQPCWSSMDPLGGRRQQYEKYEISGVVPQDAKTAVFGDFAT